MRMTGVFCKRQRVSMIFCFSPSEHCPKALWVKFRISRFWNQILALFSASLLCFILLQATSKAVSNSTCGGVLNIREIKFALRSGFKECKFWSLMVTSPCNGFWIPMRVRRNTDFPTPFLPSSKAMVPGSKLRLMPFCRHLVLKPVLNWLRRSMNVLQKWDIRVGLCNFF